MRKLNIGIIKGIFFIAVIYLGAFTMKGEDNNTTKEKIMEIKLNDDFIFGEGVSDDKEIAYGVAMDDLLTFANELKGKNSQEKLSMSDLITQSKTLVYNNGSRYEVIVYIPFKIVIDTARKESTAKSGIVFTKPGIIEYEDKEPEIEEEITMVAENQIVEVPVEEIPVEKTPVKEEEPVKEEPQLVIAQESPKAEVQKTNEEVTKSNISPSYDGKVEEFLLTQDNFAEIKSFLSEMKHSGIIVDTGVTDSSFGLPEDASLILLDELGGILAVLSPANSQGRINYRTHKTDSENNYNSKFILWYRK